MASGWPSSLCSGNSLPRGWRICCRIVEYRSRSFSESLRATRAGEFSAGNESTRANSNEQAGSGESFDNHFGKGARTSFEEPLSQKRTFQPVFSFGLLPEGQFSLS